MDSFRGLDDDAVLTHASEEEAAIERPPEIGVDERRMHVRAYNYWVSLLNGRPYPSIADVDPHTIEDFGSNSVLLDFSVDPLDPEISFLGKSLRFECSLDSSIRNISQVPARSLLSRLTDHYMQIIANRAPIGFEAEFVGQRGHNTLYRGILMPLSSNGESIDFIYGVINWKELADHKTAGALENEIGRAVAASASAADCPTWADGPNGHPGSASDHQQEDESPTLGLWTDEASVDAVPEPGADASLADRLCAARASAELAVASDQRSRTSLYAALALAHDFALAADDDPLGYAELIEDSGLKVQSRAPMTPIVKLIFGVTYDKTRLTEFAACLCWARREGIERGALAERLAEFPGGLKGIVQAERDARRPALRPRQTDGRDRLNRAPILAQLDLAVGADEGDYVLLIARRDGDHLSIIAPVSDERLIDRAIKDAA